ncbi:MAG: T9SS type A sorting domain-containing protein, partial [Bacteroidales bacterium]|nr:T9SS type A sorting domain-containing protein [Bacteroidales bacterium]
GGTWTQIGLDIDGEAALDWSGKVSLSVDGSIVAIGAPDNDGNGNESGHVRVYQNTGGTWTQIGADIDGEAAGDRSGRFVSLSADGSIVAIGAPHNVGNGPSSGHVRVFDLGTQQTLQASFASNTTNTCIQEIVEFYDQSTGGVVSWDWAFEGGSPATSTSQNPMVVYFTPGIYDVTLTVGDGVEFSTMTFEEYMTVVSVPDTPETPGGDDEVCTNFILTSEYVTTDAMYAESYEWEILPAEAGTIDGTGITGTVTWTTNWEGTATIKVKGINEACGESELSDAFEVECSICTGIGEYGDLAGIQVYPNPSNGQFTVKFDKNIGQTQIVVMNMLNQILYDQSTETMNANAVSFDLSNYAEGVYFVRIKTDSSEQIRKIIVQ